MSRWLLPGPVAAVVLLALSGCAQSAAEKGPAYPDLANEDCPADPHGDQDLEADPPTENPETGISYLGSQRPLILLGRKLSWKIVAPPSRFYDYFRKNSEKDAEVRYSHPGASYLVKFQVEKEGDKLRYTIIAGDYNRRSDGKITFEEKARASKLVMPEEAFDLPLRAPYLDKFFFDISLGYRPVENTPPVRQPPAR